MPRFSIDNQVIEVRQGATILDAARQAGIEIPTLCYLPGRPAQTSCYLCLVKVEGSARFLPACATGAADGMVVESETEEVRDARRTALELLLSDHLGDCIGPCQGVCPAHMDIPEMIRHIAAGRMRQALITVKERIALPAVLGRICPELCEKPCRRGSKDDPISICLLKRYVADADLTSGDPYLPPCRPPSGKRVAIIGSGPAGLAAAYYLLQDGHACTLLDDHDQPGGMLRYGVSPDVLPHDVLDAEIDTIARMGAEFRCGIRVGADISLSDLRHDFDAALIAVGDVKKDDASPLGLEIGSQGVKVNKRTMMADLPGVFAAGSAIIPSRHAIRAVADGRAAAGAISRFLAGGPV
ncbi:MAG: (2Fe-2S)-binding protein, partial [Armatimonadetes bacterium]|nr:(2Fe-2S)-binding protein [Armatimonadota bacterium]